LRKGLSRHTAQAGAYSSPYTIQIGIEVVHGSRHIVCVTIAGTEDNSLLLRASGLKEIFEKVLTHHKDTVRKQELVLAYYRHPQSF